MPTKVNLTGEAQFENKPRPKLDHEARYTARIVDVKEVLNTKSYNNPNETVEKIPIVFEMLNVANPLDGGKLTLDFWVSNKVTKGSKGYSSSKLYELLEKSKRLDSFAAKFKDAQLITNEEMVAYLRGALAGLSFEVEVANAKRGTESEYSTIGKVVKLLVEEKQAGLK